MGQLASHSQLFEALHPEHPPTQATQLPTPVPPKSGSHTYPILHLVQSVLVVQESQLSTHDLQVLVSTKYPTEQLVQADAPAPEQVKHDLSHT